MTSAFISPLTLEPVTVLSYVAKCSLLMGTKNVHLSGETLRQALKSRAEEKRSQPEIYSGRRGGAVQGPRRCGAPLLALKMEGNSMIKECRQLLEAGEDNGMLPNPQNKHDSLTL